MIYSTAMNCHNNNINDIITEYDIRKDPVLSTIWKEIAQKVWDRIENYGEGINNYGHDTLAPHLTRIAEDSRDFLLYLEQPEHVAANFYDAIKISDLGKTHNAFNPAQWKIENKADRTKEVRRENALHTTRGPEVLMDFLKDAPKELLEHPHIKTVIPVHMEHHHTAYCDNRDMGIMMEVACIVDSYDGDMDHVKIGRIRPAAEQYDRMMAKNPNDKYRGSFREQLVEQYFDFRQKERNLTL